MEESIRERHQHLPVAILSTVVLTRYTRDKNEDEDKDEVEDENKDKDKDEDEGERKARSCRGLEWERGQSSRWSEVSGVHDLT